MTHENKDYIEMLRSKGYRVTPQRLIVLDAVCALDGHAMLPQILLTVNAMDDTIDRSTVYRALDVLQEVGLIIESDLVNEGKIYRVAGESNHHHLVCLSCNNVSTISSEELDPLFVQIRDKYDFSVQAEHLVLKGLCKDCQTDK